MKKLGLSSLLVLVAGCMVDSGATLSLMAAISPDAQCKFSPTATDFLSYGILDPHGYGKYYVPREYNLYTRMQNRAFATTDDPGNLNSPGGSPVNVRPDANDITVFGFETCWDLADRHVADNGAMNCSSLPADQRAFLPASGSVEVASTSAIAVQILSVEHLRAANLFGPAFDPAKIPEKTHDTVQIGNEFFALPLATNAIDPARDPEWGNFPADPNNTARLIVALKAKGHNMVGESIDSNWWYFAVNVIPGYLATFCGVPRYEPACGANKLDQYIGNFLDLQNTCLAGAGGFELLCVPQTTCLTSP